MLIQHPSNCVQQQPLLQDRVLLYLLIDHQRIEQQHQRSQAKDSFAKTCQTQFDIQQGPGVVSAWFTIQICGCFRAPPVFTTIQMTICSNFSSISESPTKLFFPARNRSNMLPSS